MYETFLKSLLKEKYDEVMNKYKELLNEVHLNFKSKIKLDADFFDTANFICSDIDNDNNIDYGQKSYLKAFFSLAAFNLYVELNE